MVPNLAHYNQRGKHMCQRFTNWAKPKDWEHFEVRCHRDFFHCRQDFSGNCFKFRTKTFSHGYTFRAILIQGTTWYFPATFYKNILSKKSSSYLMSCFMHLCLYNISPNAWITWNLAAARPFPISAFDPILPRQQLLGNRCPLIIHLIYFYLI